MTDRRYTLMDVTTAAGEALKLLTPAERLAGERQVNIVLQGIIDRLKALPLEPKPVIEYHMTEMGVDAGGFYHKTNGVKVYEAKPTADENAERYGYASPND